MENAVVHSRQLVETGISRFGREVVGRITALGSFIFFVKEVGREMVRRPIRWKLIVQQLDFIGNQSLKIIVLVATTTRGRRICAPW